jgi:hypothetical protein
MVLPIQSLQDAFQVFLARLWHAATDENPLGDTTEPTAGEIEALEAAVAFLAEAGDANGQYREQLVSLLDKVQTAFYRRHFGNNLRPVQEEINLAFSAAKVNCYDRKIKSILKEKKAPKSCNVPITMLVELVAKEDNVNAKALKEFRADLGRKGKNGGRRATPRAIRFYDELYEHLCRENRLISKNGD